MTKKIPERTCVICRTKKPRGELFRFLVNKDKGVVFDKNQDKSGRGFYICSKNCWDKAIDKKRKIRVGSDARRSTTVALPEEVFEEVVRV